MSLYSMRNNVMLTGKCVAITGSSSGIGVETARELSKRGAKILMLCRNEHKTRSVMEEIADETGNQLVFYQLDLSSFASIRACAHEILGKEEKLDMLINNAGVMACPKLKTHDGHEIQFGTNHLGHFLLTNLLLPKIQAAANAGGHPRIIILSSMAHAWGHIQFDDLNMEQNYDEIKAYTQSKLANILHGKKLARELEDTNISVYMVHPGLVNTNLLKHMKNKWYGFLAPVVTPFFKSPIQGAQTTLYCALDEKIEQDSGKYYADCKEETPNGRALSEDDQDKLWSLSKLLVALIV